MGLGLSVFHTTLTRAPVLAKIRACICLKDGLGVLSVLSQPLAPSLTLILPSLRPLVVGQFSPRSHTYLLAERFFHYTLCSHF